jgi:hypothetical protein
MKTNDMIALLATNVARVERVAPVRHFLWPLLLGSVGAILTMLLIFGVRSDIVTVMTMPLFWAKVAFPVSTAAATLLAVVRLSQPGVGVGRAWQLVCAPVVLVWLAAAGTLLLASSADRLPMLMGATWRTCAFNIALLSVPTFMGVIWGMKQLAPTRLRMAGAAAGLLGGSISTIVYCFHCPEMQVSFWAVWYVAGMLIPVIVGALLGPRLLRW